MNLESHDQEIQDAYQSSNTESDPNLDAERQLYDDLEKTTLKADDLLTVYGTAFCPMVGPVRRLLDEASVHYEYIDIRQDRAAAARVREITGGYESVPTLVFPDGKTLIEPGMQALRKELLAMGEGGEALASPVTAMKAGLSNPIYLLLALIALALLVAVLLSGCADVARAPEDGPAVGLPNPASVNCEEQGGTLQIETQPDGGQFGLCYFEDNRQCEEWALFRGDCPVGGIDVSGYETEAGRFCAISGGMYAANGTDAANNEAGSCTLPDGTVCEAQAFYEGRCGPRE
jgi:putative hemolysin/glutaredoxin